MDYTKQRKLAATLFPEHAEIMLDENHCFGEITNYIKENNLQNEFLGKLEFFCSEWAYRWALNIGNRDVMINRVTDSYWAYEWARVIGDQDVMINRVTDSEWAYEWALNIGNRNI